MSERISSHQLSAILRALGYKQNTITWAVEILEERIDPLAIMVRTAVDRQVFSFKAPAEVRRLDENSCPHLWDEDDDFPSEDA